MSSSSFWLEQQTFATLKELVTYSSEMKSAASKGGFNKKTKPQLIQIIQEKCKDLTSLQQDYKNRHSGLDPFEEKEMKQKQLQKENNCLINLLKQAMQSQHILIPVDTCYDTHDAMTDSTNHHHSCRLYLFESSQYPYITLRRWSENRLAFYFTLADLRNEFAEGKQCEKAEFKQFLFRGATEHTGVTLAEKGTAAWSLYQSATRTEVNLNLVMMQALSNYLAIGNSVDTQQGPNPAKILELQFNKINTTVEKRSAIYVKLQMNDNTERIFETSHLMSCQLYNQTHNDTLSFDQLVK